MRSGKSFKDLFKRYRLRAEFANFSELGMCLAEKGFIYEDSIFSHWQKGDRIPNRTTILKLIEIFAERQSIRSLRETNEFLETAGEGYLTEEESKKIQFNSSEHSPFQVPNQIGNFTGREELIKEITRNVSDNIILIHGSAGVGKSALAIQLGHLLQDVFPDGVLWFKLDTSDVMDILFSIAYAFGKDIGFVQDREIRASMVRSLLANKKVLLIFDNVEFKNDIHLLIPNNKNCFVIITSRYTNLPISTHHTSIFLETFSSNETILLFQSILGDLYITKNKSYILKLAETVGFLPLALHIFAKELKKESVVITEILSQIKENAVTLQEFSYGDNNLYIAINYSYELLDNKTKKIFVSLAVFNGKDFSIESVAYINELSMPDTKRLLNSLKNISLIEESTKTRYRIHPMIKKFLRTKLDDPIIFLKAAKYYEIFLAKYDKSVLKSYPNIKHEGDNVLYIFKKCYELHYWDEVIDLWDPLETLLDATHQLDKMRHIYQLVKIQKTGLNIFQKILIIFFCMAIIYWMLLNFFHLKVGIWNYIWNLLITLIPFISGLIGFFIAKSWGLFKNSLGKVVFFLSAGLFTWGTGNMIWAYLNFFLNISVPYPSFADVGYIVSYPLWTIGIINLPHALGEKINFRKKYEKILIFIPVFVLMFSYYLMVFVTKNTVIFAPVRSWLKLFFDIAYPTSDAIILTAALLVGISFKFFGEIFKYSLYILILGFFFMYLADFSFSYTTSNDIYYNGSIIDLLFIIALSCMSFGVLGFYKEGTF